MVLDNSKLDFDFLVIIAVEADHLDYLKHLANYADGADLLYTLIMFDCPGHLDY